MLQKLRAYASLLRIRHWIKNGILLIPAFYGGAILQKDILLKLLIGFLSFACCASAIYTVNDLCDIEKDRSHPVKCKRPLASGAVSRAEAVVLICICTGAALVLDWLLCGLRIGALIPVLYLLLNLLYSLSWKNKPVADIVILVSGFFLRMLYGSYITDVRISSWLYLTLISLSVFMAFGKRRNEKRSCGEITRTVLKHYSDNFLNSSMYVYLAIFLVFYALWSTEGSTLPGMIYTTPLVFIMTMRYTYMLEQDAHGNPVDMILGDWVLLLLGALYAAFLLVMLYFPGVLHERL